MPALYFIAIAAPSDINSQVLEWKKYMYEHYGCKVALRSPAHITLIPPFPFQSGEALLVDELLDFARHRKPFVINVRHFSSFPPRVIFADVESSAELKLIKTDVEDHFIQRNLFPVRKENRPFRPHITIANRDLQKHDFIKAWQYFKEKTYQSSFEATAITVYRSAPAGWETRAVCPFDTDI